MQCTSPVNYATAYSELNAISDSEQDFQETIERLKDNDPTLQKLDLKGRNLDSDRLCALTAAIAQNQHLTELDLSENQLDPTAAQALADALMSNTVLTKLRLASCELGPSGMRMLKRSLSRNAGLTELDLSDNGIEKEGVTDLSFVLILNKNLETIELGDNPIDDYAAQMLLAALQRNGRLNYLGLDAFPGLAVPIIDETFFNISHSLGRNFHLPDPAALPTTIEQAYVEGMKHYAAANYLQAFAFMLQSTLMPKNDGEKVFMNMLTDYCRFDNKLDQAAEYVKAADKLAVAGFEHMQSQHYLEAQTSFMQALAQCRDHTNALQGLAAVRSLLPESDWNKPRSICNLV